METPRRWWCLISGLLIQSCAGLSYAFALYSEHLKHKLGYTQVQTAGLSAAKDFGGALGIAAGVLYYLYPPWVTVVVGAASHLAGYGLMWGVASGTFVVPYWMLCVAALFATGGDSWADTACMITSLENFPESRGRAMGVLKAQVGLSSAMFTQVYHAFLKPNTDAFLLMVALVPPAVFVALAPLLGPDRECQAAAFGGAGVAQGGPSPEADKRFKLTYGVIIAMALYLMLAVVLQELVALPRGGEVAVVLGMFAILSLLALVPPSPSPNAPPASCCPPFFRRPDLLLLARYAPIPTAAADPPPSALPLKLAPLKARQSGAESDPGTLDVGGGEGEGFGGSFNEGEREGKEDGWDVGSGGGRQGGGERGGDDRWDGKLDRRHLSHKRSLETSTESTPSPRALHMHAAEETLWTGFTSLDFWLLFFGVGTAAGSGVAIINNFAQIGKAIGHERVDSFVGLISIWSCFGRLLAGYCSDLGVHAGWPRATFLALAAAVMSVTAALLSYGWSLALYASSVLVGLSFGAFWSLTPAVTAEVFGMLRFGAIYKVVAMAMAAASYSLSMVTGVLYDNQAAVYNAKHGRESLPDKHTCLGKQCFQASLLVLSCAAALGSLAFGVVAQRSKHLYIRLGSPR